MEKTNGKPIILITMGDPAGVGPEIIVKALYAVNIDRLCPVIIGDKNVFFAAADRLKRKFDGLNIIDNAGMSRLSKQAINFVPVKVAGLGTVKPGESNGTTGKASISYLEKAVNSILMNEADAIVTCPLSKKAINDAGYFYNGHTDFFAEKTNTSRYAMCFYTDQLKVALVSDHVPVRKIHTKVKLARVLRTILLLDEFIRGLGRKQPRLAVLGLNPHAGEFGLIGIEEYNEITPAVSAANRRGVNAVGPMTTELGINNALDGNYDAVVAMYHDQGILPFKLLSPHDSVNVTLGLPFIRTSVSHGTGFDIAGLGTARETSLVNAIKLATDLALSRRRIS